MKKIKIFVLSLFFTLPTIASAQYYSGYPYYGAYYGNGTAGMIMNGINALQYGLNLHSATKAQEQVTQSYQYQAGSYRSYPYNAQSHQDLQNMQKVAPFFEGAIPVFPEKKK